MIEYRPYRNSDPPGLVALFRGHSRQTNLVTQVTPAQLEDLIFAKLYFDRHGLIVAEEAGQLVGFVHAGPVATPDGRAIDPTAGVTSLLLVLPHAEQTAIRAELLRQSESYLRSRGATVLWGGGAFPGDPFYHGLYGGSELPGVLASDAALCDLFRSSGYVEAGRRLILQLSLGSFRPPVSRTQMQLGRQYKVETDSDPAPESWWDACTFGHTNRRRCSVLPKSGGESCGSVLLWEIEPLSSTLGTRLVGLTRLKVAGQQRRKGLATLLVIESLRQLQTQGFQVVEAHVDAADTGAGSFFKRLGFQEVDQGILFRRH